MGENRTNTGRSRDTNDVLIPEISELKEQYQDNYIRNLIEKDISSTENDNVNTKVNVEKSAKTSHILVENKIDMSQSQDKNDIVALEKKYKIKNAAMGNTNSNKVTINAEKDELSGVFKTEEKNQLSVFSAEREDSKNGAFSNYDKDVKGKNKKITKDKNSTKQQQNLQLKRVVRNKAIKNSVNFLIKPESDEDNNMSTGVVRFLGSILQSIGANYLKRMIIYIASIIGNVAVHIAQFVLTILMVLIVTISPVIIVLIMTLGFFFVNNNELTEDNSYYAKRLNNIYDNFEIENRKWSGKGDKDDEIKQIVYINDCKDKDNFKEVIVLYITFTSINNINSDDIYSYLIVDTDYEQEALQRAFDLLNVVEIDDNIRYVNKLSLEDIKDKLTEDEKVRLEAELQLLNDNGGIDGISDSRQPSISYTDINNMIWAIPGYGRWCTDEDGMFQPDRVNPVTGVVQAHRGVDISAPAGTKVYAVLDGVVIDASYDDSRGNHVVIEHENGIRTHYFHSSELLCQTGDEVHAGDLIMLVGSTGQSTGNHLHFGITVDGEFVDPYQYEYIDEP